MTEKLRKFAFSYPLNGRICALTIEALTPEQAIERVKAMSQATYDGEIFATIPIAKKETSWITRLIVRLLQKS